MNVYFLARDFQRDSRCLQSTGARVRSDLAKGRAWWAEMSAPSSESGQARPQVPWLLPAWDRRGSNEGDASPAPVLLRR